MARTTHGILDAEYGTSSALSTDGDGTSISNIVAGESQIEFLDEEGNPVDADGNQYPGALYAQVTLRALDLTAFAAIRSNWTGLTKQYFRFDLSNSAAVHTDNALLLSYIRPINIEGQKQGRSDGFEMQFRVPYDELTFS